MLLLGEFGGVPIQFIKLILGLLISILLIIAIDGNYWVITLIFKKYGNLPLCLENYALFYLPPIFTNHLYTY